MKRNLLIQAVAALALNVGLAYAQEAPAKPESAAQDKAATTPAPAPDARTRISPAAQIVLDQVTEAYGKLKSLELTGTFTGNFEAAGQKQGDTVAFTSSFEAPNKFRHDAKNDVLVGSTGEKAYTFIHQKNMYLQDAAPKEKVATSELPKPIPQVLGMQDPSLMLALAKDPAHELAENVVEVSKVDDTKVGDLACPTLKLDLKNKSSMTLAVDPQTHLVRQATTDVRAVLEQQGVPDVKKASYTVDYSNSTADGPIKGEQFAWAIPEGAKDAKAAQAAQEEDQPAMALVGKEAPDFKLAGLDGKDVKLSDLKGKVVVLDFWATWCGPCRMSLPHLDKLYGEKKADGVQFFAISVDKDTDKAKVEEFVKTTKLGIPVLLDPDSKVGTDYKADAIPETVVVGKDGKIAKVFIGFSPEEPAELKALIEKAQK